jgi:hypothetical protein
MSGHQVTIADFQDWDEKAVWIKDNCTGVWFDEVVTSPDIGRKFYFSDEKDALLFGLRWI